MPREVNPHKYYNIEEIEKNDLIGTDNFQHLAEALPQIVWTAKPDGVLDYISPQWGQFTGLGPEDEAFLNWLPLIHPDHQEETVEKWTTSIEEGTVYDQQFKIKSATGQYVWFHARALPVIDASEKILKWYGTTTNIQSQKNHELELIEEAKKKDEFIAMLSHELRNPLAAISTAYELLKKEDSLAPEQKELSFTILGKQISHLSRIVEDTLDIARLKSGKLQLISQRVEMNQLVKDCFDSIAEDFKHGELTSNLNLHPEPLWVKGDSVRLSQCIINLLNNAVKFTPQGGSISLSVTQKNNSIVIEVKDTGIGIRKDDLSHLFEAFSQGQNALEQNKQGLGLGLAVINTLLELHHGTVQAESTGINQGSKFTITLPLISGPTRTSFYAAETTSSETDTQRILLIEDNPNIRETLKMLLELEGHEVRAAEDGESAFTLLEHYLPETIFCDLSLPGAFNGWEIAARIRSSFAEDKLPYLVALSGFAQPKDIEKSLQSGFHKHIAKPPEIDQIRACLKNSSQRFS